MTSEPRENYVHVETKLLNQQSFFFLMGNNCFCFSFLCPCWESNVKTFPHPYIPTTYRWNQAPRALFTQQFFKRVILVSFFPFTVPVGAQMWKLSHNPIPTTCRLNQAPRALLLNKFASDTSSSFLA